MRKLAIVGVVAFVVVDIALVVLAMRHVSGTGARSQDTGFSASPTVNPSAGADDSQDKNKDKDGNGKGGDKRRADGPAGNLLLSISEDGTAARGVRGTCKENDDASVEISSDSGATFDEVTPGLTSVLHVEAVSDSEVWVVGTNDACKPRRFVTDDLGKTWDESSAKDSWYFDPNKKAKVHGTNGTSDPGCVPKSVIVVDASVGRVRCDDGDIRGTSDGGDEWVRLGSLDGVAALGYVGPGNGYALASTGECDGQVFTSTNGGSQWDSAGCIDGKNPEAIAANDQVVLAQVDGQVFRSTDDGQTWEKA